MNTTDPRRQAAATRTTCLAASLAIVGFFGACSEAPTSSAPDASAPIVAKKGGKPPSCDAFPTLTITLVAGDALQDDGGGPYTEGGTVGAHLSINGNLMFWTSQYGTPADRFVNVVTDASPDAVRTTDRIYTNTHENPDPDTNSCGLAGMDDGSGTAVLEVELDSEGIVRYGKDCSGKEDASSRVKTTRSGNSWTIENAVTGGLSPMPIPGVHCRNLSKRKGKPSLTQVGTAGAFEMRLSAP